jgi:hypothetical protein
VKIVLVPFCAMFFVLASQKSHFWHLENAKNEFSINNIKIHFGNIVSHVKIHLCVKYGNFIVNYAKRMGFIYCFLFIAMLPRYYLYVPLFIES